MVNKDNNFNKSHSLIQPALALFTAGKFQEALDLSEELRKTNPDDPVLPNLSGACYAATGEYDKAIIFYNEALAINQKYSKAHYNLGGAYHQAGILDKAVLSYKNSILHEPDYAEAYNNLGVVYKDLGDSIKASSCFKDAIEIKPNYLEALLSLAILCQEEDQTTDAILNFKKVLELEPNFFEVHNNLGVLYQDLAQLDEAEGHFRKAISINDSKAEPYCNLANILKDRGNLAEAIDLYETAVSINPGYEEAHYNLGLSFYELNQIESAISSYKKAISLNSHLVDAHLSLGVAHQSLGNLDGALECYQGALELNPLDAHIHFNLATVFKGLDDNKNAIQSYQNALSLKPDMAEAHNNIGNIFNENGKFDEALKAYNTAIDVMPDYAEAHHHIGSLHSEMGEFEKAIESFNLAIAVKSRLNFILGERLSAKMHICSWNDYLEHINRISSGVADSEPVSSPFHLLALIDDPYIQRKAAEIYSKIKFPGSEDFQVIKSYPNHTKIRIGYFSSDFRDHAVSYLTAELYEAHDRSQFEVHAFSLVEDTNDLMNVRIKEGVDYFHSIDRMSSKEIVDFARSLEIDIAVDLNGYTAGARTEIFSMFVAPIQLSYIGYLGTMGASCYDYLIADRTIIPEESQKFYSEKIVYLPSFQVNDSKDLPPKVILNRKDLGLPEDKFIFCCFNNTYKYNSSMFDTWARILDKTPESVLIVYASNAPSKINLTQEIINRGIDSSRLFFAENVDRPEYLARYRLADLFLDTHPYNAGTTASDALKMGLPILTFTGNSFQARMGASILNAVNMPELIASSIAEYESLAVMLAKNPNKLKSLKDKLRHNLSKTSLYDTNLFAKSIELAYKKMYERKQRGMEPENIFINTE